GLHRTWRNRFNIRIRRFFDPLVKRGFTFFKMLLVSHLRTKRGSLSLLIAVALGIAFPSLAQKPEIKGMDAVSGPMGSVVTITGDNFGTDASKLRVRFGAAAGTIKSVSNQVIEVVVPEGATFETVSV